MRRIIKFFKTPPKYFFVWILAVFTLASFVAVTIISIYSLHNGTLQFDDSIEGFNYLFTVILKVPLALTGTTIAVFGLSLSYYRSTLYEKQSITNQVSEFRSNYLELCKAYLFTKEPRIPLERHIKQFFPNIDNWQGKENLEINKEIKSLIDNLEKLVYNVERQRKALGYITGLHFTSVLEIQDSLWKQLGYAYKSNFFNNWIDNKNECFLLIYDLIELIEFLSSLTKFKSANEIHLLRKKVHRVRDDGIKIQKETMQKLRSIAIKNQGQQSRMREQLRGYSESELVYFQMLIHTDWEDIGKPPPVLSQTINEICREKQYTLINWISQLNALYEKDRRMLTKILNMEFPSY
ncbi:MAG: hypothetical protein AAF789_00410 [Bacteroidota bacterium]